MQEEGTELSLLTDMKNYLTKPEVSFMLSIMIPLLAIATMWGRFGAEQQNMKENFNNLESRCDDHMVISDNRFNEVDEVFLDIRVKLTQIAKDIEFIKVIQESNGG